MLEKERRTPVAKIDVEPVLVTLRERFTNILLRVHSEAEDRRAIHLRSASASPPAPHPKRERGGETYGGSDGANGNGAAAAAEAKPEIEAELWADAGALIAWAHIEAVIDLVAGLEPALTRAEVIAKWELALPLVEAFSEDGDPYAAHKRTALVLLGVTLPNGPLREVMKAALDDARARAFLGVHEANGVKWLAKERFEELARFISDREAVDGRASVALTDRQVDDVARVASKEGYRAEAIAKALVADVKLETRAQDKPEKSAAAAKPAVKR
jgi:hypothetical protein